MPYVPDDFRPPHIANRPSQAPSKPQDASEQANTAEAPTEAGLDLEAGLPPYIESVQVTPKPRKRGAPPPKTQTTEQPMRLGMRRTSIKSWKVDPAVIAKQLYG